MEQLIMSVFLFFLFFLLNMVVIYHVTKASSKEALLENKEIIQAIIREEIQNITNQIKIQK